jgi:hypothetical protein
MRSLEKYLAIEIAATQTKSAYQNRGVREAKSTVAKGLLIAQNEKRSTFSLHSWLFNYTGSNGLDVISKLLEFPVILI